MVAGVALGLAIAAIGEDNWRLGCLVIGASLCLGAVERLALPKRYTGLMQVRGQAFDVAVLAMTGGSIIALALWVHA